jgi:transposase
MAAIIFMARTSTPWALLPVAEFGCDSVTTCWRRFAEWAAAGVFERLQELLLDEFGQAGQLDWSRVSVDSVSLRAVRDVLPADPHRVAVQVVLDDGLTSRRLGNPRPTTASSRATCAGSIRVAGSPWRRRRASPTTPRVGSRSPGCRR